MLTYSILSINILYYKNKLYINKLIYNLFLIYIYTSRALINESILIRVGSRALIESSRVYTSLHRLINEFDFVFTNSLFNN
jgi:tRNA C32,U32 (ribose-2'-O)-methylase TrmJ